MPRTKIVRRVTRNRQANIRHEVIREFESELQQFMNGSDLKVKQVTQEIDMEIGLFKTRISQKVLGMKIGELMRLGFRTFSDIERTATTTEKPKSRENVDQLSKRSREDEGYLTEESKGSANNTTLSNVPRSRYFTRTQRNAGPLSTAKANRRRRSRSACGNNTQVKPTSADVHVSRQKGRVPVITRQKAFSADRTASKQLPESPTALLRWPKPGELVLSVSGSPVVAQVAPGPFANVNIPIRDGVISLRPKKLRSVDPHLVHRIEGETFSQIKLLQSNLELLMSFAHKK